MRHMLHTIRHIACHPQVRPGRSACRLLPWPTAWSSLTRTPCWWNRWWWRKVGIVRPTWVEIWIVSPIWNHHTLWGSMCNCIYATISPCIKTHLQVSEKGLFWRYLEINLWSDKLTCTFRWTLRKPKISKWKYIQVKTQYKHKLTLIHPMYFSSKTVWMCH